MFDLELYRKRKGLKQSDISSVLGIHQATISKAERGEMAVPRSWLEKLNDKYGDID